MHASALAELQDKIDGPMMFRLRNKSLGVQTHGGVLEFDGEERGVAYLPTWMLDVRDFLCFICFPSFWWALSRLSRVSSLPPSRAGWTQTLMIDNGGTIEFTLVKLPTVTFMKLQVL